MISPNYSLGWRKESDLRNLNFLMRDSIPIQRAKTKHWSMPIPVADQGRTGTCVGHAGWHRLVSSPVQMDPLKIPTPFELYRKAVLLDQWTDNDGDATASDANLQAGTSTLGLMKALTQLGLISKYEWAYTARDIILGVGYHGPVTIGIPFYDTMFNTDGDGFVQLGPQSKIVGGHEMLVTGWDNKRGVAYVLNSWGPTWGVNGHCFMSGETLQRLIDQENGEGATPTEIKRK